MKFKWSGGKESGGKKHPFNMNENLMGPLNDSKLLKSTLNNNNNFELDSNATSSTMVPAISTLIKNDSLLKTVPGHIWTVERIRIDVIFSGLL